MPIRPADWLSICGVTDWLNGPAFDFSLAALRSGSDDIAKVSIIGAGMRSHSGVASKMFFALAGEGINIEMISTSEIKISCVIEEKYTELAVRALHQVFGLGDEKEQD